MLGRSGAKILKMVRHIEAILTYSRSAGGMKDSDRSEKSKAKAADMNEWSIGHASEGA